MTTKLVETAAFADVELTTGAIVIDNQHIPHGPVVDEIMTRLSRHQVQTIKDLVSGESGFEFTNITLEIDGGLTVGIHLHRVPLARITAVNPETHGTFITFSIGTVSLRDQMQESYGVTIEGKVHRATRLLTRTNPCHVNGTESVGLALVLPRFYGYQIDSSASVGDASEMSLLAMPDLHYGRRASIAYEELAAA